MRADLLPRDCSIPIDTILFRGAATAIGQFRCPVEHTAFRDSGPIEQAVVVFPRTSVWIKHEGSQSFVADPNVVTIYNRAQRYERRPISPDGDRCDWFAVSDDLSRDIVSAFDPAAANSDAPFRFEIAASTPDLYLRQRRLARRVARGVADALETEEEIVSVVAQVIGFAYQHAPEPLARRATAARRRRQLAEHAKVELGRTMRVNQSASEIASAVGTSVFHLCRIFRAHTGRTMHDYRTELRLRAAFELVADDRGRTTLAAVAHEVGFASHSHLVRVCRSYLGAAPRAVREMLRTS